MQSLKMGGLKYYLIFISIFQSMFSRVNMQSNYYSFTDKLVDGLANFFLPSESPLSQEIIDEAYMEATDLIKHYGYPVENQTIRTQDDYFLISQRILNGKTKSLNTSRIPVVLLHSLACDSPQWFDNGPTSLAFLLADKGYDVWVANFRGSTYSYHAKHSSDSSEFWNFSNDDHTISDFPAIINHVLNETHYSKLLLIGHSLGAIVSLSALAMQPEYNSKVAGLVMLAPPVVTNYITSLLAPLVHHPHIIEMGNFLLRTLGIANVGVVGHKFKRIGARICAKNSLIFICEFPIHMMFGYNPYLRNRTRMPIYGQHCASGMSGKELQQILHATLTHELTLFDYGPVENAKRYNQTTPPGFNYTKVSTPTVIFYAPNDCVATPINVALFAKKLPKLIGMELFPDPTASHSDFIWAANIKEFVYDKVIKYLEEIWNQQQSIK